MAQEIDPLQTSASTPAAAYSPAMGYLRAFVTVLVVIHHSVLAYHPYAPAPGHVFAGGDMLWRAFPVVDVDRWMPASLITGFNDNFFMSLMFLLSGLFIAQSVAHRGVAGFLRERVLRLGIPFLFSALLIAPAAYYFAWLQSGGTGGLGAFWTAWRSIGYWPTGPAWFILLLLVFDVVAAFLFALAPAWSRRLGVLASRAREKPARFFWLTCLVSLIVFTPMVLLFGFGTWTYWSFFQFETARVFHYFVYFLVGAAIGAYGLSRGLVAEDGTLAKRWWLWLTTTFIGFVVGTALFIGLISTKGAVHHVLFYSVIAAFVLDCAIYSFTFLALFARFVKRRNSVMDSLAANAYGIYVVHYAIVAALQYALLGQHLPGGAKAGIVIAGALALSWLTTLGLRRIPVLSRLVGE